MPQIKNNLCLFGDVRYKAFSLVELMVAIAVLAILALMIFPFIRKGIEKAEAITCATNLRTCGQAVFLYANEHNDYYPPAISFTSQDGTYYHAVKDAILPYLRSSLGRSTYFTDQDILNKTMRCPTQREIVMSYAGVSNESALHKNASYSFGINPYISPNSNQREASKREGVDKFIWVSRASVLDPAKTIMMSESGYSTANGYNVGQLDTYWFRQSTIDEEGQRHPGIHGQTYNNILWCDGHVSPWEDIERLFQDPYEPGGSDDRWHPY